LSYKQIIIRFIVVVVVVAVLTQPTFHSRNLLIEKQNKTKQNKTKQNQSIHRNNRTDGSAVAADGRTPSRRGSSSIGATTAGW